MLLISAFKKDNLKSEKEEVINYFNEPPSSIDENGIYYINLSFNFELNERNLVVNNSVFYIDSEKKIVIETVLNFKQNGTKEFIDLSNYTNISMDNRPLLDIEKEDIENFKRKIINEDYNICGMVFTKNNQIKSNKELIFTATYQGKQYIAITQKNYIKLEEIIFLDPNIQDLKINVNKINYLFKRKLLNGNTDFFFMFSKIHSYGSCLHIFTNPENIFVPKNFVFVFYIIRARPDGSIIKIVSSTSDCSMSKNTQIHD